MAVMFSEPIGPSERGAAHGSAEPSGGSHITLPFDHCAPVRCAPCSACCPADRTERPLLQIVGCLLHILSRQKKRFG